MSKSALLRLGLGTLGVGSVAVPSVVAVHKSKQLHSLTEEKELKLEDMDKREYALDEQTKDMMMKRDAVKHMEDSAVMEIKHLLDETDKYRGIYQRQLDKNAEALKERDELRQKIEDLQADLTSKKQLVAIQRKTFIDQINKIQKEIERLKKSQTRSLSYSSWSGAR